MQTVVITRQYSEVHSCVSKSLLACHRTSTGITPFLIQGVDILKFRFAAMVLLSPLTGEVFQLGNISAAHQLILYVITMAHGRFHDACLIDHIDPS